MAIKAPIIFKIKFSLPNNKEAGSKNAAHIKYIALRPGVVREVTEKDLESDLDMGFKKIKEKSYESYIHEREGSHGLFGPDDKQPSLVQVQKELRDHKGIVWRAIISLREDDANYLGYTDKEMWQQSIRSRMAETAKEMGISESNLKWVAAFHQAKGHPHVHLVFWEKAPQRSRGKLSNAERVNIRKALTKEFYREERDRLGKAKTEIRKYVLEKSKGDLDLALELTKEIRQNKDEIIALEGTLQNARPAPVLYTDQAHELSQRINSLANIMPGKGRKSLAYMPADVKDEARDIADWILSRPGFKLEAKKYIETAEGFSRHYSKHEDQIKEAGDKAYGDLRDRVAQEVLGHAGIIQRDIEKIARRNEVNILSENESLEHRDLEPEKFSDSEIAVRGEQHPSGGASGGAVGNGDGGSCGGGNGSTGGSARDSAGDSAGGGGEGSSFTGAGANISDTDKVLESLYKRTCRLLERDIYEKIGVFERTKLVYDNTQKYFEEEILCDLETLSERIADIEGKPVVDYFSKEIKEFVFNITEKLLKQNDIALLNNMSDSPDGVKKAIAEEVISHAYDLVPKDIPEVMVEKDIQRAEEAIKKIPDGNVFFIRGDLEEIEWTIKTLYRSYLMLGFEEGEATNNAIFFSEKNGFDNARKAIKQENERLKKLKELLEKKGKAMPTYISRKDWTRLRENLGYKEKELLYPWFGVVNNQAETERDKIKFEVMEEKANEFHAAILHGFNSNIDNKEILWTIKTANFALQSFNVQAEEREAIVSNWCLRSQLKIPEARIKDIIDRSELLPKENFCLGREKWGQLINNLGMEEMESPWRFKGQTNYINRVWKSIWTAIKREQARQEMEAAISRRKLDRKLARVAEEQERNNKQRR